MIRLAALLAAALVLLGACLTVGMACGGGSALTLTLKPDPPATPTAGDRPSLLADTAAVLRRRAELYGLADANADVTSDGAISVALSGIERETAVRLLTARGALEFRRPSILNNGLVACKTLDGQDFAVPKQQVNPDSASGQAARCFSADRLGTPQWLPATVSTASGEKTLSAESVQPNGWELREDPSPTLAVRFTDDGALLFEQLTSALTGYDLGVFIDGALVAAPRIQRTIKEGRAVISGFDATTARILAAQLNSGPLPVALSPA